MVDVFRFGAGATLTGGTLSGGDGNDLIIGDGDGTSFTITALDFGIVDAGGAPNTFSSVETLQGGAGADSFTFNRTGRLSGAIDGVGGDDSLTGDDNGNVALLYVKPRGADKREG